MELTTGLMSGQFAALKANKEWLEKMGCKDLQDHKDLLVMKELQAQLGQRGILEIKVNKVFKVLLAQRVILDQWDYKVLLVMMGL